VTRDCASGDDDNRREKSFRVRHGGVREVRPGAPNAHRARTTIQQSEAGCNARSDGRTEPCLTSLWSLAFKIENRRRGAQATPLASDRHQDVHYRHQPLRRRRHRLTTQRPPSQGQLTGRRH
jgi:hypothetical protein